MFSQIPIWLPGQDSVTTVETFCFFLRNLPFGFLPQHILCCSSSHPVGGILASSPANEKSANKKGPYYRTGLVVCWLPIVDEFRNFLMSEDANIVLEQIKDF
jgi:hypothetical protein